MVDFKKLSIEKALELLKTKQISSKELVEFYLKEAENKKNLNAYISLNNENAINSAKESDKKIVSNNARPPPPTPL